MTAAFHFTNCLFIYIILFVALEELPSTLTYDNEQENDTSSPNWFFQTISLGRWIFFIIVLGTLFMGIILGILIVKLYDWSTSSQVKDDVSFLDSLPILPPRFSGCELNFATTNFSKVLGRGGFSTVYEGTLPDGKKIAVKKSQRSGQGQKEFQTELSIIGNIHHDNVIRLYGFFYDGLQRMLVFEFIVNGSLDQWIFGNKLLPWAIRFHIAIDVATGLSYLHNNCRQRIIHFDIKPQNILLDYNFKGKIADFGLAMLYNKEESQVVAYLRGTKGYYAPDFLKDSTISNKCDVYSFGMVLLEIIGSRKIIDEQHDLEKWFFPSWVVAKFKDGSFHDVVDIRLHDMLLPNDWLQAYNAIKIALWCIQYNPQDRPSMENVILMLKGVLHIGDPPLAFEFLEGGAY